MISVYKSILLLSLLMTAGTAGSARTTDWTVIREKINLICPGAVVVDTGYREGFTEVEFICNNEKAEAGFDGNNELIYTEKEVTLSGVLYEKIKKKLDKSYEGWIVDDIHLVETADTSFYSAELIKDGIEEKAYFSHEGKYYRPLNVSVKETWAAEELKTVHERQKIPYNFLKPSKVIDLPDVLREISGMAMASENRLYLIQDELGALFEYDLKTREVGEIIRFTDTGDFEDVAVGNQMAYVLRSDGTIFSFKTNRPMATPKIERAPVQSPDNEGLFYDPSRNLLFLSAKSKPENGDSNQRLVYQMVPGKVNQVEVAFTINTAEISRFLAKSFPGAADKDKDYNFNPSAIAVHPLTGETYVLSANDRMLAVFENKKLKKVFPLPAGIYHKPEGLAFAKNGDLYISSEGIKNGFLKGRIIKLNMK